MGGGRKHLVRERDSNEQERLTLIQEIGHFLTDHEEGSIPIPAPILIMEKCACYSSGHRLMGLTASPRPLVVIKIASCLLSPL